MTKRLTKKQAELLAEIKADETLTHWFYYSTQYESSCERVAISFAGKLNLNHRALTGGHPRLLDLAAITPEFIRTYK